MKKKWLLVPPMAVLALSGCSSAGNGHSATGATSPRSAETGGSYSTSVPHAKTTPPTAEPAVGVANGALVDAKCTKDSAGSWSFESDIRNSSSRKNTYTVAVAVTVGSAVKGHALLAHEVAANSVEHVAAPDFAVADDSDAACEPVASVAG